MKLSSGLASALLASSGLYTMMNKGVILLYDGTPPATPDEPPGRSPIGYITNDGVELSNDRDACGLQLYWYGTWLQDNGKWAVTPLANATPTWWRWCWVDDPQIQSTYYPRIDGEYDEALFLRSAELNLGVKIHIDAFRIQFSGSF